MDIISPVFPPAVTDHRWCFVLDSFGLSLPERAAVQTTEQKTGHWSEFKLVCSDHKDCQISSKLSFQWGFYRLHISALTSVFKTTMCVQNVLLTWNDSCSERTLTVFIRLQLNMMELLDAFAISDRTAAKTCLFQAYSDVLDVFVYSTEISVCSDFAYLT